MLSVLGGSLLKQETTVIIKELKNLRQSCKSYMPREEKINMASCEKKQSLQQPKLFETLFKASSFYPFLV